MVTCAAIIVAAGAGKRFGGATPKQFLPLKGLPVFLWSVRAFMRVRAVRQIIVVVPAGRDKKLKAYAARYRFELVTGGKERYDSVKAGIERVRPGIGYIAIHDGARPMVTKDIILRALSAAKKHAASLCAVPARDTVKLAGRVTLVRKTLPRENIWLAQTPQVFKTGLIKKAYQRLRSGKITDDAQAVELAGGKPALVLGDYKNIKITDRGDLKAAERFLRG